jgi:hypothetical protein
MYALLDTFFNLPAILVGIKTRVWEIQQPLSRKLVAVHEIWQKLELIDEKGDLTAAGQEIVQFGQNLAEYYVDVLPVMLATDLSDDTSSISPESYQKLRAGLADYHRRHIAPFFWASLGFGSHIDGLLVDVCGGAGLYSKSWIGNTPDELNRRKAIVIDRPGVQPEIKDPEKAYQFWAADIFSINELDEVLNLTGKAKVVLLSEILHCKSMVERSWLVDQSRKMLDGNGGSIVVNERHPNSYFSWRMACLTKHGESLSQREIAELMVGKGYKQTHTWTNSHYHATRWTPA